MKSIVNRVMVVCLLVTLAGTAAFAKSQKANITLTSDTTVNGALVKKGMYAVVFDDQTGELSIFKGEKLIVKTATRLEKRDRKARGNEVQTILDGMDQKLVSVTFGGSDEDVVVAQAGMQAGGN
jgi:hypothetical protein